MAAPYRPRVCFQCKAAPPVHRQADLCRECSYGPHRPGLAHIEFAKALRDGRLTRPESCEHCGAASGKGTGLALDGHHGDYTKPLEVLWLCRSCHKNEHARLRRECRVQEVA